MRSAAVLAAGILAAAALAAQGPSPSVPSVEAMPNPAATGSAQPQLSGTGPGMILSWIERRGTGAALRFATRTPAGWSAARTAASGDNWFVNWADVPSVVRLDDGTLTAHWLQKSGTSTYAYDVRLASSRDDGRTWSASWTPHDDGTKTEHGFASLFQLPDAGLGVVWLDGRNSGGGHDGHDGAMSLRFAAYDGGRRTAEQAIDQRTCDCCPTAVTVTAEGPLVAYRDRSDAEVRDIVVTRFEGGRWSVPVPVHGDDWTVNACPVNGPALAARQRRVALAWYTARDNRPQAFVAFSNDAGRTFGAPIRVDDEQTLGRVGVVLLPDDSAAVTWIEQAAGQGRLMLRRIHSTGRRAPAMTVATLAASRASGYPRIGLDGNDVIVAWTDTGAGQTQVRTVIFRNAASRLP